MLPPGTYSVTASYPGDVSYGPSTGTTDFTIAKAPTTETAAVMVLPPIQYATSVEIAAEVDTTSIGVPPTGTFQFLVDRYPVVGLNLIYESGSYNPVNSLYAWEDATTTIKFPSVGNHTLAMEYSGDANYAAGTSPPTNVTVTQAQPAFTTFGWVTNNQPVIVGQTVNTVATLDGAGVTPSGTITFSETSSGISGTETYTTQPGELMASMPYTFTVAGVNYLNVSYSGDSNYLPAWNTEPQVVTVLNDVNITPAGTVNIAAPGQSGSTALTIAPNGGFTGVVSLTCRPDPSAKESSCSFSNGSSSGSTLQVNMTGSNVNITFSAVTTAPHQIAQTSHPLFFGTTGLALAGLVLLSVPSVRRRRRFFLGIVGLALAMSLGACGGGGGGGGGNTDHGTVPGTYSFEVLTSTNAGSSVVTFTTVVTVIVQ